MTLPQALVDIVAETAYRPCWEIEVDPDYIRGDSRGPTLVIRAYTNDTYSPERILRVNHWFPVPPVNWNRETWTIWLFQRFLDVEHHEASEYFTVAGRRPFAPGHGAGDSPYLFYGAPR
jgi:hypothetical protein